MDDSHSSIQLNNDDIQNFNLPNQFPASLTKFIDSLQIGPPPQMARPAYKHTQLYNIQ